MRKGVGKSRKPEMAGATAFAGGNAWRAGKFLMGKFFMEEKGCSLLNCFDEKDEMYYLSIPVL